MKGNGDEWWGTVSRYIQIVTPNVWLWKTRRGYLCSTGDIGSLAVLSWQHSDHLVRKKDNISPALFPIHSWEVRRHFKICVFQKDWSLVSGSVPMNYSFHLDTLWGMGNSSTDSVRRMWGNRLADVASQRLGPISGDSFRKLHHQFLMCCLMFEISVRKY